MVFEVHESMTFVKQLASLTPDQWLSIEPASGAWDAAWDCALGLGALTVAVPVMAAARAAGAGPGRAALAGAAAAAVALEDHLSPEHFDALYAPFSSILPRAERRFPAWGRTGAA